jgi:energy-coupling factor transport system substrate-specific component
MHELAEVWTDRKGLAWIAVTALLYALILIPFNQYHWEIAGITLRPAAVLPVVFGILWGPAAAWGLGIGNVAGDLFGGSWSGMSLFGFLNNFFYSYLSYLLWHRLMRGHSTRMDAFGLGGFWVVTLVTTFVCLFLLAASGTLFFGRPFESKFISYFGNSIAWAMLGGPILFRLLAGPACESGFVYGKEWEKRKMVPAGGA